MNDANYSISVTLVRGLTEDQIKSIVNTIKEIEGVAAAESTVRIEIKPDNVPKIWGGLLG